MSDLLIRQEIAFNSGTVVLVFETIAGAGRERVEKTNTNVPERDSEQSQLLHAATSYVSE